MTKCGSKKREKWRKTTGSKDWRGWFGWKNHLINTLSYISSLRPYVYSKCLFQTDKLHATYTGQVTLTFHSRHEQWPEEKCTALALESQCLKLSLSIETCDAAFVFSLLNYLLVASSNWAKLNSAREQLATLALKNWNLYGYGYWTLPHARCITSAQSAVSSPTFPVERQHWVMGVDRAWSFPLIYSCVSGSVKENNRKCRNNYFWRVVGASTETMMVRQNW